MLLVDKFQQLKARALAELKGLSDVPNFELIKNKYLGRRGELAELLKNLRDLAAEEKPILGALANEIKTELELAFAKIEEQFGVDSGASAKLDVTIPGIKPERGTYHPVMQVQRELEELFKSMGFMVLDGPELESEYYNFEALNIPAWHPARDTQDTFYVYPHTFSQTGGGSKGLGVESDVADTSGLMLKKGGGVKGGTPANRWLLRTHTSPVQVRALEKYGAPLRAVVPGRVFRYEATDASHEHTFWQMEGLVVDENISISHLIATMKELLKGIFRREVEVRLRPGYFPFVEPGFELDIKCFICAGVGCSVCKQRGWVELLPCGLVHPKVLQYGGINPKKYSGFAFGLGLSRLVMMRYKIDDIRLLLSGDLRFLKQF
ncbi:MAG: phenylalanine--tRNA ligase subunit alpha [Patescibacteria group bacterium]